MSERKVLGWRVQVFGGYAGDNKWSPAEWDCAPDKPKDIESANAFLQKMAARCPRFAYRMVPVFAKIAPIGQRVPKPDKLEQAIEMVRGRIAVDLAMEKLHRSRGEAVTADAYKLYAMGREVILVALEQMR